LVIWTQYLDKSAKANVFQSIFCQQSTALCKHSIINKRDSATRGCSTGIGKPAKSKQPCFTQQTGCE